VGALVGVRADVEARLEELRLSRRAVPCSFERIRVALEWVPDAQRHREQLGMSKIDVRREPGEQLGSGEPLLETTSDRPVDIAVLREQDVVLGRRDAAEEVLQ